MQEIIREGAESCLSTEITHFKAEHSITPQMRKIVWLLLKEKDNFDNFAKKIISFRNYTGCKLITLRIVRTKLLL